MTDSVMQTFNRIGVHIWNPRMRLETTDGILLFCETYGFEHVFVEDSDALEEGCPFEDGEPFIYLWISPDLDKEMRFGYWSRSALPTNGTSLTVKLSVASKKWNKWNKEKK